MKYSITQLKELQNRIKTRCGLSSADAARIIGHYNGSDELDKIAAGDFAPVLSACNLLGLTPTEREEEIPKTAPRKSEKHNDIQVSKIPVIDGEIIEEIPEGELLPSNYIETIEGWLADFSARYDIELTKASGQQWRSACIYIGQHIQASGILRDKQRERTHGGKIYKAERVAALLPLWEYITGIYKHVCLACDFIAFSGVSREWYYDSKDRGLTSSRVDLLQKARAIEEAGLSVGLNDGKENPTGRIYYTKARLGWQENTIITHVTAAAAVGSSELPKLTDNII